MIRKPMPRKSRAPIGLRFASAIPFTIWFCLFLALVYDNVPFNGAVILGMTLSIMLFGYCWIKSYRIEDEDHEAYMEWIRSLKD